MFNWFNMKKKSLPQQVLENTKDIEKLYDQELSDITQLNYKQDAEDSLTYADGKATFKGKMSIIRNENTQNLVVDSDIEVNISSGDDDIIIDAGEDNVSLKIRLDNITRNKINRALLTPINTPNEREFVCVGTNNAQEMIGESELFKGIERFEDIYNKDSLDFNENWGYTGGISSTEVDDETLANGKILITAPISLNLTKYKYVEVSMVCGNEGFVAICNNYEYDSFRGGAGGYAHSLNNTISFEFDAMLYNNNEVLVRPRKRNASGDLSVVKDIYCYVSKIRGCLK